MFEDKQSKVDDILQTAMVFLQTQKIAEVPRQLLEHKARMLSTLQSSRDRQFQSLSKDGFDQVALTENRFSSSVRFLS